MHPEPMISDAQYIRSRILELNARHRLVAQAAQARVSHRGPRYRLGGMLIAVGSRLQGIAPNLPDRQSLPSSIPAVRSVH